jgi:hypothetical protein
MLIDSSATSSMSVPNMSVSWDLPDTFVLSNFPLVIKETWGKGEIDHFSSQYFRRKRDDISDCKKRIGIFSEAFGGDACALENKPTNMP